MSDPILANDAAMAKANMRPSVRLALRVLALEANDRELRLGITLLQDRLKARAQSDALAG